MANEPEVISMEELQKQFGGSKGTSIMDLQGVFNDFIKRKKIERITRIRDVELDKICRMLYFGIRHTAFLNLDVIEKAKKDKTNSKINFHTIKYEDLDLSSILEYTLINLSLRLSLDSQSRNELKEIITSLIGMQMQKELKAEEKKSGNGK